MSLRLQYLNDISSFTALERQHILGTVAYDKRQSAETGPALTLDLVPLQPAGGIEVWTSDKPVHRGQSGTLAYASDGDVLFGTATRDETALPTLEAVAQDFYGELFSFLASSDYPQLFRVWNYLPKITGAADGMERYRRFNIGRHAAFLTYPQQLAQPPAATGIGSLGGKPSFYFLAGKHAVTPLENPRQVSAYHYPPVYGPRGPTFSRAGISLIGGRRRLAISGTASIVGHASLHAGDAAAQTRETLANIRILLTEAAGQGLTVAMPALALKAYIRRPADLPAIRQIIESECGCRQVRYLQADICRAELLVEIEAFA